MTEIVSTLKFGHSLRQSAEPIEGIVQCKNSGDYITYDNAALRLWSRKTQKRSLRLPPKENISFLQIQYLTNVDCVAIIFTARKSSNAKGGYIFLISENLSILQEIPLNRLHINKLAFVDQRDMIMSDDHKNITIWRLSKAGDFESKKGFRKKSSKFLMYDDEDSTLSGDEGRKKGGKEMYNPPKVSLSLLSLIEKQSIQLEAGCNPQEIVVLNPETFLLLDDVSIRIYSRNIKTVDSMIDSALKKAESATVLPFTLSSTVPLKADVFNPFKRPKLMRQVEEATFLIGFNDGSFQVISIAELITSNSSFEIGNLITSVNEESKTKGKSTVLCEFQAHSVRNVLLSNQSRDGVLDAHVAPWRSLQSGDVYTVELFTAGGDKRLAHWGLRKEDIHPPPTDNSTPPEVEVSKSPKYTFKVDLLGEHQLSYEPPSHISTKFTNDRDMPMKNHFIAYEMACLDFPIRKCVACTNGGLLMFFDVIQQYRPIGNDSLKLNGTVATTKISRNNISTVGLHAMILSASRGPTLMNALYGDQFGENDSSNSESTLLILKKDVVEIVSLLSGSIVQHFSTLNLKDHAYSRVDNDFDENGLDSIPGGNSKFGADLAKEKLTSSYLANGNALMEEIKELEGVPTIAHWCNLSRLVVVGYSLGGVGIISLNGVINSDAIKPPYSYLRTTKIHGSEITLLTTFNHTIVVRKLERKIVACLVGDSNGALSLWQIYPESKTYSPILSSSQRHPGRIIFGQTCLLEPGTSKRILVTACSEGTVRAWKLQEDGELSLMAYFRSERAKLTTISIAPITTKYAALPSFDDDSSSLHSQSTMTKKSIQSPSEEKTQLEKNIFIEYEIHCICGFADGTVESWLLSNDQRHSYNAPIQVYHENKVSVSKIVRVPQPHDNYVNIQNHNECIFSPFEDEGLESNQGCFLVSFGDGTQCSLILDKVGMLTRRDYFTLPDKVNFIVTGYNTSPYEDDKMSLECVLVSDFSLYEVLLYCAHPSILPRKWQRNFKDTVVSEKSTNLPLDQIEKLAAIYERQRNPSRMTEAVEVDSKAVDEIEAEEVAQAAVEDEEVDDSSQSQSAVSLTSSSQSKSTSQRKSSSSESSESSESSSHSVSTKSSNIPSNSSKRNSESKPTTPVSTAIFTDRSDGINISNHTPSTSTAVATLMKNSSTTLGTSTQAKEYIGSMEAAQRILSTELHFAKKNQKLLEQFSKNALGTDGTVSPAETVEIVFNWLNSIKVARESIWELLKLLEIKETDRLKFIEVAKIGAVVSSALNKTLQEMGENNNNRSHTSKRLKNYKKLKSYTTKVTYNSMGEKVIEKVELQQETMGLYNGFVSTIRRIWNDESCRIITQSESRDQLTKPIDVRLRAIPEKFKRILNKCKLELPVTWLPAKNAHWFDPLRVIRIARTLLDIRSSKQHEAAAKFLAGGKYDIVESMETILVKYFERNYGNKDLHVTPAKVINYLEACLQYQHHPIVNILQGMLMLEPSADVSSEAPHLLETAIWVCAEARSTLCSRGCVVEGSFMQPYNSDFNYMETFVKDGAVWQVRWQLIRRVDAISIVDEILRSRGRFGPAVYLQIFAAIESVPWIAYNDAGSGASARNINEQMIDFECFLEVLFFEFFRFEKMALESEHNVFGEGAMTLGINVLAREINNVATSKRKFVIDDQDFQYGMHHDSNMSKIKWLLTEFAMYDTLRTGKIDQIEFEQVLREKGTPLLRGTEEDGIVEVHIRAFLRVAHKLFLDGAPMDPISYIDLCATLLGWEFQCQGDCEITFAILANDIPNMKRSIEQSYANELIRYFSSMRLLDNLDVTDPIWVMLSVNTQQGFMVDGKPQSTFAVPTDGDWVVNTAPPADISSNPFFTDGLNYSMKSLSLGKPAVVVEKITRSSKHDVHIKDNIPRPQVPGTNRLLKTVHGEVAAAGLPAKSVGLCPISRSEIKLDIMPFDPLQQTQKDSQLDVTRHSFSRSISEVQGRNSSQLDELSGNNQNMICLAPEDVSTPNVLTADSSIVVQLRSLLPPTLHPPQSPGADLKQRIPTESLIENYSRSPDKLGTYPLDFQLSNSTVSDNLYFQENHIQPYDGSNEPSAVINNSLENFSSATIGLNNGRDSNFTTNFESGVVPSRPSTSNVYSPVQSSNAVFPSTAAGAGFSAYYGGGSLSTESSVIENIAKEEVQNRLIQLKNRDQQFEKLFQQEREEFERKEKEKRKLRHHIRRELIAKEKESMEFYQNALNEKYRVSMKGRAQLDAALKLEDEDKKQRELEIQKILARNKERALQLQEHKMDMKREEEERKLEGVEKVAMAKEDQLSALVEKSHAAALKAAKELANKLKKQELEDQMNAASLSSSTEEDIVEEVKSSSVAVVSLSKSTTQDSARMQSLSRPTSVPHVADVHEDDAFEDEVDKDDAGDEDEDNEGETEFGAETETEEVDGLGSSISAEEETMDDVLEDEPSEIETLPVGTVEEEERTKSEAEKRLDAFISRLNTAYHRNDIHPRRTGGKDDYFFIPLAFSDDISFNPFATYVHTNGNNFEKDESEHPAQSRHSFNSQQSEVNEGNNDDDDEDHADKNGSSKLDPFADIKRSVKSYKKELEKQRNLLYSLDDMAATDFLRLYRRGAVKWNDFFVEEKRKEIALRRLEDGSEDVSNTVSADDDVYVSDDDSVDSVTSIDKRNSFFVSATGNRHVPQSLRELPDVKTAHITPLPFGKVLKKLRVPAMGYKYFQIEVTDKTCILTIEMKCKKGFASMYLSRGYLPSSAMFELEAHPLMESKVAQISFSPKRTGTLMLAVHATEIRCKFNIWACATKDSEVEEERPSIARVNKLLKKFDILSQYDPSVLEIHFPRLYQEAGNMSEEEMNKMVETANHKRSILSEMKQLSESEPSKLQSILSSTGEEESDDEVVEMFVAKVGRYAMKKEREIIKHANGRYRVDYLFNIRDPNLHGDLFQPPHLSNVLGQVELSADESGVFEEEHYSQHGQEFSSSGGGTSKSNVTKVVVGRQRSFLNVFEKVKTAANRDSFSYQPLIVKSKHSSKHSKTKLSISSSEPELKLPPIGINNHQVKHPQQLIHSYSHLTMDVDGLEDDWNPKKMKKIILKDPLLKKAPTPVSYKLSKS